MLTLISFQFILPHHRTARQGKTTAEAAQGGVPIRKRNLAQVLPGHKAKILSFSPNLSAERRAHLQAYGLLPGHWVRVLQHAPVTVLAIEQFELALETELAGEIQVEEE